MEPEIFDLDLLRFYLMLLQDRVSASRLDSLHAPCPPAFT